MRQDNVRIASCAALAQALGRAIAPDRVLDAKGYAADLHDNLVDGVFLADFEADLRQGDGNELESKFRAAYSSSALAVNNFAPFKAAISDLVFPGSGNFRDLVFERKCPHGLAGRNPNLDVLASGSDGIFAIESKCLEYLSAHAAEFASAYEQRIRDERRDSGWFEEMQRLIPSPRRYRRLDAAQLIKHAFGLAHSFPKERVTLLYLFWEPENPNDHPVFAEHREEIARFAAAVGSSKVEFKTLSYPELWQYWLTADPLPWLRMHVQRLMARYSVSV